MVILIELAMRRGGGREAKSSGQNIGLLGEFRLLMLLLLLTFSLRKRAGENTFAARGEFITCVVRLAFFSSFLISRAQGALSFAAPA